jgi:hypothetical protein
MIPVSLVAAGAINDTKGVAKKAMSNAFFSIPLGRRDRKDGTTKSHHHQNPNTLMEVSLLKDFVSDPFTATDTLYAIMHIIYLYQ